MRRPATRPASTRAVLAAALAPALLALGACRGSTQQAGSTAPAAGSGAAAAAAWPAEATPAAIALGDSLFNNGGCRNCHGTGGVGGQNGPALNDREWVQLKSGSFSEIVGIITTGVPLEKIVDKSRTRAMGARGGRMNLTDAQITAVAAYVYSLSHTR
jgi:mono/diheme cytochrome c family protein